MSAKRGRYAAKALCVVVSLLFVFTLTQLMLGITQVTLSEIARGRISSESQVTKVSSPQTVRTFSVYGRGQPPVSHIPAGENLAASARAPLRRPLAGTLRRTSATRPPTPPGKPDPPASNTNGSSEVFQIRAAVGRSPVTLPKSVLPQPSEIAVMTLVDSVNTSVYKWMWPLSYYSKVTYCKKHGYDLIIASRNDTVPGRHMAWSKPSLLLRWFSVYQYILWQDVDAIFTNYKTRIEFLLILPPDDVSVVVAKDAYDYNSGSFLVRRSNFTRWFLEGMLRVRLADIPAAGLPLGWHEQSAFIMMLRNLSKAELEKHVYLAPQRMLNSYPLLPETPINQPEPQVLKHMAWQPGDFVAHTPGCWFQPPCQSVFNATFRKSLQNFRIPLPPKNYRGVFPVYPKVNLTRLADKLNVTWPLEPATPAPEQNIINGSYFPKWRPNTTWQSSTDGRGSKNATSFGGSRLH